MSKTTRSWLGLIPFIVLLAALLFGGRLLEPPPLRDPAPEGQAADPWEPSEFDASSARARLTRVLGDQTPHPVDSATQDEVRERLLREIREMGYRPRVEPRFTCRAQPRAPVVDCALVRNITFSTYDSYFDTPDPDVAEVEDEAASLRTIGVEGVILAATHYDSVPAAPGASDAGVGIAAWLEIAKTLRNEPIGRPVLFLITDGEEPGLLGAHAFASDPRMNNVSALVNLEARGTRGPAIFFESNAPNEAAVAAYSQAPRPVANSMMADAYRLMSNSTDVTALTRPGLTVVNIALLDGYEDYHTPQDSLRSQDVRSLQHMGDQALAVIRELANPVDAISINGGPFEAPAERVHQMAYTDVASRFLVSTPALAAQWGLILVALVALAFWWSGGNEERWRALGLAPLAVAVAALAAGGAGWALTKLRLEEYWWAYPALTRMWCGFIGVSAVILALALTKVRNAGQAEAASLFWFALTGSVLSAFASGMAMLFVLPLAYYAAGAVISLVWAPARAIGAGVAAVFAILIWAPTLYLAELALGFAHPAVTGAFVALVALTLVGSALRIAGETNWQGQAIVCAVAAVILIVAAGASPTASAARPQALNISLFVNTDTGQSRVLAGSAAFALPSEVTAVAQFTPELILPGDRSPTWAAVAPDVSVPAPRFEVIGSEPREGRRLVRGRIIMNGAYRATVRVPRSANPLTVTVKGVSTDFIQAGDGGDYLGVACQGRDCDGAAVEILLGEQPQTADWYVIGQYPGASAPAATRVRAARPQSATQIQNGDVTLTLSSFRP